MKLLLGCLVVAAAALALIASACGGAARADTVERTVTIHYSRFDPDVIEVPAGVPVTFTLKNQDPIDHEWIVGDAEVHERHRTGTEPSHTSRPTEVTVPALSTRVTTISFDSLGELQYICHLPAHEEYGMVGTLHVVPGTDAEGASG